MKALIDPKMRRKYLTVVLLISLCKFSLVTCLKGNETESWECVRNVRDVFYKLRKNRNGDTECATNKPNQCYYTKKLRACLKRKPKGILTCTDKHRRYFDSHKKKHGTVHWCQLTEKTIQHKINGNYRIKDGADTHLSEFPFMTRLAMRKYNYSTEDLTCGGSLFDSHWILTAAHCVYREHSGEFGFQTGT